MPDVNYFVLHEEEIRRFIERIPHDLLNQAACLGVPARTYHPEIGPPDEVDLARCDACVASVACVALALRAEEPDVRDGWYGGLGPDERADLAERLGLSTIEPEPPERAAHAIELFRSGWTINSIASELGCCRRTVQRYLRTAA